MNNTKHTPGPWRTMDSKSSPHHVYTGDWHIATAWSSDVDSEIQQANARLIAAAPELLDALEQVLADHLYDGVNVHPTTLEQLKAAIAKATQP